MCDTMAMIRLFFIASVVIPSFCQIFSPVCHHMQCTGPKFTQSICCEGFICVSSGHLGPAGMLMCVVKAKHIKVKSLAEIMTPQGSYGPPILQNHPNVMNQQLLSAKQFPNPHQFQALGHQQIPQQQNLLASVAQSFPQNGHGNSLGNTNFLLPEPRLVQNMVMNPHSINGIQNYEGNPSNIDEMRFPTSNVLNSGQNYVEPNRYHPNQQYQGLHNPLNNGGVINGNINQPFAPIQVGFRSKTKSNLTNSNERSELRSEQTGSTAIVENQPKDDMQRPGFALNENNRPEQMPKTKSVEADLLTSSQPTGGKDMSSQNYTIHSELVNQKHNFNSSEVNLPVENNTVKENSMLGS